MESFKQYFVELSKVNQAIKIKGDVQDKLKDLGFKVSVTDTTQLVFFTDKPINKKSAGPVSGQYITSFGTKGALKFLAVHNETYKE